MGLDISFTALWDSDTVERIERALRHSIGDPPSGEAWRVSVASFGKGRKGSNQAPGVSAHARQ
jgi:hypothetical protein